MTQPPANPERGKEVFDLDRAHVFHSWSAQSQISPLPVAGGEGSYFWDFDGKKYLDFSCQLVFTNIGFQHPKVVKAIQEQAALITAVAPQHANEARGEAAKRITERAGAHHNKVFFTNGGADAVENAIRMVRLHTNRHKVPSFAVTTAIPALRLQLQAIRVVGQMSSHTDMYISLVHISTAQPFGHRVRKKSASALSNTLSKSSSLKAQQRLLQSLSNQLWELLEF